MRALQRAPSRMQRSRTTCSRSTSNARICAPAAAIGQGLPLPYPATLCEHDDVRVQDWLRISPILPLCCCFQTCLLSSWGHAILLPTTKRSTGNRNKDLLHAAAAAISTRQVRQQRKEQRQQKLHQQQEQQRQRQQGRRRRRRHHDQQQSTINNQVSTSNSQHAISGK